MFKVLTGLFFMSVLIACNISNKQQPVSVQPADSSTAPVNNVMPVASCYAYMQNGDTLIAGYHFASESMISVRQVALWLS